MQMLRVLILSLVAVVAVTFAVGNRHVVRFMLDPLSGPQSTVFVEAPLFVYLFAALLIGFLLGASAAWINQGRWRRAARLRGNEAAQLKRENERLSRHLRAMERSPQVRNFASSQDAREERHLIH